MAVWLLLVGFLMVSRIPTFSFKRIRVRRDLVLPTLLVVGLTAALLASYPWFVVSAFGVLYIVSIPFSIRSHRRLSQGLPPPPVETDGDEDDDGPDEKTTL